MYAEVNRQLKDEILAAPRSFPLRLLYFLRAKPTRKRIRVHEKFEHKGARGMQIIFYILLMLQVLNEICHFLFNIIHCRVHRS